MAAGMNRLDAQTLAENPSRRPSCSMNLVSDWLLTTGPESALVVLSALGIYAAVILLTRLVGLRSFSKMSSFDFAMTVAIGSIIAATVVSKNPPLLQAVVALAAVYGCQYTIARLRKASPLISWAVDNEPVLLMIGQEIIQENMRRHRVTEHDLWAKLREANVLHLGQVRAVVLETTGDISVLHGDAEGPALDPVLLLGVRDRERFDRHA